MNHCNYVCSPYSKVLTEVYLRGFQQLCFHRRSVHLFFDAVPIPSQVAHGTFMFLSTHTCYARKVCVSIAHQQAGLWIQKT